MEGQVLTPKGFALLGDIKVGDQVCNPDGTVATVIATHDRGQRQFYRVTFADGASVEVCGEHLWGVRDRRVRKRRKVAVGTVPTGLQAADEWNLRYAQRYQILTTEQVRDRLADGRSLAVPLPAPPAITAPPGRWPVLPPYTMGVWIGDGSSFGGSVMWSKPEPDLAAEVAAELDCWGGGLAVSERAAAGVYGLIRRASADDPAHIYLSRVGLNGAGSHQRFIPDRYKLAPPGDRLALVQGLMDTDGSCDESGYVEYVTTSERLAIDMQWMLRSLGFTAKITLKEAPVYTHGGERRIGRPAYRLYVRGNGMERLFRLARKRDRCKARIGVGSGDISGDLWCDNPIVSVEPTVIDFAKCITVDNPNGLYVTDDFIVTHNSSALLMHALLYVESPFWKSIIFRKSYTDLAQPGALMERAREWLAETDAKWNQTEHRWYFPSGSSLTFGHMSKQGDRYKYQGAEYTGVHFDELTQFPEQDYRYLFSRIRRARTTKVPLRMRSACVDEGDVLTAAGWKPIQAVQVGERVYSLDATGRLDLQPVEWVYAGPATDGLVRVRKRNLYMSMTPDHRVVWKKSPRGRHQITPWDQIRNKVTDIVRCPTAYAGGAGIKEVPFGWAPDHYLAFLGLFLAEGSTSRQLRARGKTHKTIITQVNQRHHGAIKELLNALTIPAKGGVQRLPSGRWRARWMRDGVRVGETFDTEAQARACVAGQRQALAWCHQANGDFVIAREEVWRHFSAFGKAHEKRVPRDILADGTPEQLRTLLRWMWMGDGTQRGDHAVSGCYFTSSPGLADDVQEAAIKLGYKVQTSDAWDGDAAHRRRFRIYLATEGDTTRVDRGEARNDVEAVAYDGPVYCIKVAMNGNFVLRQRGSVWVSGNTNPGGVGHEWVKQRFLEEAFVGRVFMPAMLEDNPSLDPEEYDEMLQELDIITRNQLRHGDWNSRPTGGMFNRLWFIDPSRQRHSLEEWPTHVVRAVRFWDLAATEVKPGNDPDFTAGALVGLRSDGKWVIGDIQRFRESPAEVERRIRAQAEMDGKRVAVRIEQEPGASGVTVIDHYARKVLVGYDFKGYRSSGKKSDRARPFSAAAENGNVLVVRGRWLGAFFDEIEAFPLPGGHDDQVDAVSGAIADIMGPGGTTRIRELLL